MKIKRTLDRTDIINIIGVFVGMFMIALMVEITISNGDGLLSSDNAAEFILGKNLADSNSFLSNDWYYSSEIRAFGLNSILMISWKIAHTYAGVAIVSQTISLLLLYLFQVYFYKKIGSKYYCLWPVMLLCPFSVVYFLVVTYGLFYLPYICINFWLLGLLFSTLQDQNKLNFYLKIVLALVISFLSGINGLRQIINLFLPLLAVSIILCISQEKLRRKSKISTFTKKHLLFSVSCCVSAFLGYSVYSFALQNSYQFPKWEGINYQGFSFARLEVMISDILVIFGFGKRDIMSFQGMKVAFSFLIVGCISFISVVLIRKFKLLEASFKIYTFYVLTANFILFMLYSFSDMAYVDRYQILTLILFVPLCCVVFEKETGKISEEGCWNKVLPTIFIISILVTSCDSINTVKAMNRNSDLLEVISFLEENDYEYGYATYWFANVTIQLSEEKLCVCPIYEFGVLEKREWLTSKEIIEHNENGKVFLIVSKLEWENQQTAAVLNDQNRIIYRNPGYLVYEFSSTDDLYSHSNGS